MAVGPLSVFQKSQELHKHGLGKFASPLTKLWGNHLAFNLFHLEIGSVLDTLRLSYASVQNLLSFCMALRMCCATVCLQVRLMRQNESFTPAFLGLSYS